MTGPLRLIGGIVAAARSRCTGTPVRSDMDRRHRPRVVTAGEVVWQWDAGRFEEVEGGGCAE